MKSLKASEYIIHRIGLCLIMFAGIITSTASFALIGETTPPKSLQDK